MVEKLEGPVLMGQGKGEREVYYLSSRSFRERAKYEKNDIIKDVEENFSEQPVS